MRSPTLDVTTLAPLLRGRHRQIKRMRPAVVAAEPIFTLTSSVTIFSVITEASSAVASGVASCQISLTASPVASVTCAIRAAVLVAVPTSIVGVPPDVTAVVTTPMSFIATTPVTVNNVCDATAPWFAAKLKLFSD